MKKFTHTLQGSKVIYCCLTFFGFLGTTLGQIENFHIVNGIHEFESILPSQDLHFYMFEDGYHSFKKNDTHQYSANYVDVQPIVYTSKPYDPDPPELLNAGKPIDYGSSQVVNNTPIVLTNKVEILRSWNLMEDDENYFILMFENREDSRPINGCIEFHFNDLDSDIVSDDVQDWYNNWVHSKSFENSEYTSLGYTKKFSWEFSNLKYGEQRFIYFPTGCLAELNDIVKTCAVMKVGECGGVVPYNEEGSNGNGLEALYVYKSMVKAYPHDPNCIVSTCGSSYNPAFDESRTVEYRIYFQNDGEGPAEDVYIKCQFNMEILSVKLIGASDGCHLIWNGSNGGLSNPDNLLIEFPDIWLPGTGMSPTPPYSETVGYVDIGICFNPAGLYCYHHEAEIIFDTQLPMVVENEICQQGMCNEYEPILEDVCNFHAGQTQVFKSNLLENISYSNENIDEVSIFPNPASDRINIEIPESWYLNSPTIELINSQGKLIKKIDSLELDGIETLDIGHLTSGVYLIRLKTINECTVKSFVKS